jgi:formylglycine-generating enzyme required for sulfatase activity
MPNSRPAHRISLKAFAICITAVTNGEFAGFVEANGYQTPEYWSEAGWRSQEHKKEIQPAFWNDSNFNDPYQPVVGVSWYEADAFARWQAHMSGLAWRLPTEAEWEAAARGPYGHTWPVGRAPDPKLTNTVERGMGKPWTACDLGNVSWCGAHDLCGNVWEWCSSRWGHNWQTLEYAYPYKPSDGREDLSGSHARVIRGGSWFDLLPEANPANRGRYLPGSRASNIGFRLVRSL